MSDHFEVIVIGGGPGGYVAAIRASQLGMKVALVEREKLGGVCLNWGCIPTKALLQSAHLLQDFKHSASFGILTENTKPDFPAVIQRSRKVADQMSKGVDFLMKKNKITTVYGKAKFLDQQTIQVDSPSGSHSMKANRFIIATGAHSKPFPNVPFDQNLILSSKEAMQQTEIPGRMLIIGAGAIGIEFADFYESMGSQVTIIEYLDHLLPSEDEEISKILERSFKKRNIHFHLSTSVTSIVPNENSVTVKICPKAGSEETPMETDKVLVGIGLVPNTAGMNLEEIGIALEKGFIKVDSHYRTSVNSIYAIGDCNGPPLLAHVASMEGIKAAEAISIEYRKNKYLEFHPINYEKIPGCTYCHPEVASFGKTEKKAIQEGLSIKIGRFPFTASGRAQAVGDTTGLVKVIIDEKYGEIIGGHIIGLNASELISELLVSSVHELTAHNLATTIHAHPTLSEAIMEAAADSLGEAINI
jgi:dihydrolipoamide dehydrogenase